MSLQIDGTHGEIRSFYRRAAVVRDWTIEDGVLSGVLSDVNALWLSQQPLTFVVQRPRCTWRWRLTSHQISGSRVTAALVREGA